MKNIIFLLLISFVVLSCTCKKKTAEEEKENQVKKVDLIYEAILLQNIKPRSRSKAKD